MYPDQYSIDRSPGCGQEFAREAGRRFHFLRDVRCGVAAVALIVAASLIPSAAVAKPNDMNELRRMIELQQRELKEQQERLARQQKLLEEQQRRLKSLEIKQRRAATTAKKAAQTPATQRRSSLFRSPQGLGYSFPGIPHALPAQKH